MTVALEDFQKDAQPWLTRLKQTGETLFLMAGREAFELRPVQPPAQPSLTGEELRLPKRDIIVGDPEELVHLDWSSEWRP
jgi:hypothetical protein